MSSSDALNLTMACITTSNKRGSVMKLNGITFDHIHNFWVRGKFIHFNILKFPQLENVLPVEVNQVLTYSCIFYVNLPH